MLILADYKRLAKAGLAFKPYTDQTPNSITNQSNNMCTTNQQNKNLGISHITGQPVRTITELQEEFPSIVGFMVWIRTINQMINSWAAKQEDYPEGEIIYIAIQFKSLFVELMQQVYAVDTNEISKLTGNKIRSISEIYNEMISLAPLNQYLALLNEIMRCTICKDSHLVDDNESLNDPYFYATQLRELCSEILINIHNGKR